MGSTQFVVPPPMSVVANLAVVNEAPQTTSRPPPLRTRSDAGRSAGAVAPGQIRAIRGRRMPVRHQWTGALGGALRVIPRANTQSPYRQGTWRERPHQSEGLP